MNIRTLTQLSSAVTFCLVAGLTTAATTEVQNTGNTTMVDGVSYNLSYNSDDLHSADGRKALKERISKVAKKACRNASMLKIDTNYKACVKDTISHAENDMGLNQVIAANH